MIVRQLVCAATQRCTYIVGCERLGVAAVVDPTPTLDTRCDELIDSLSLELTYILGTSVPQAAATSRKQYDRMLANLGLEGVQRPEADAPIAASSWERRGVPRINPSRKWRSRRGERAMTADELLLLRAGDRYVEVVIEPTPALGGSCFVVGGTAGAPLQLVYAKVQIALGEVVLDVLPLPGRQGVAYVAADRVFTGHAQLAGTGLGRREATPDRVLALPPDTIVYPGRVDNGMSASTVQQERRWARESAEAAPVRHAPPTQGWTPVVHAGGAAAPLPEGTLCVSGYRDVEPDDIAPHLAHVRVVMLEDGHTGGGQTLAGGTSLPVSGLAGAVADWDRDVPLLVVSETGLRCSRAAAALCSMSFARVYRLVGGLELWRELELPVETARPLRPALR